MLTIIPIIEPREEQVVRDAIAGYLWIQGLSGAFWWIGMLAYPASRAWFVPRLVADRLVMAFMLPDILMYVCGSLYAAWLCSRNRNAVWTVAFVAGSASYAALLCLGLSVLTNEGWLGTVIMAASMCMSVLCVILMLDPHSNARFFRSARTSTAGTLIRNTLVQAAILWGVFLFVIPGILASLEAHTNIPRIPVNTGARVTAAALFIAASLLGLSSAWYLVWWGRGTPLPTAAPRELVVHGPYRFVRNPMAVAGIVQGLAVALWLGSGVVLLYVLLGGLIWHAMVRPLEEHDLRARFGAAYDHYRTLVRCWIPTLTSAKRLSH